MTFSARNLPAAAAAIVCLAAGGAPAAKNEESFEVRPGPAELSEDERSIHADPASGIEHAVILLEETEQDDALGSLKRKSYHLRAKILSNEGRDLANVEIPLLSKESSIKSWWGRTLLPDGTVIALPEEELESVTALRKGLRHVARVYKGILPGVVPGAVIDYGYVVRDTYEGAYRSVPLQGPYLTKEYRYRWIPAAPRPGMMSSCNLSHGESLDVKTAYEKTGFVIQAKNLPPFVEEPWMPPEKNVRASATCYYTLYSRGSDDFWDFLAEMDEAALDAFLVENMPIRLWRKSVEVPDGDDLVPKLRFAYDWIATHIRNTSLMGIEAREAFDPKARSPKSARSVLESGDATAGQLDYLFAGIARYLGAEAYLVLAPDRTDRQWDPSLLTWEDQFAGSLVAVRGPGDPPGEVTMVDPGSGLPYGEIPWWYSDTLGLMVAGKKAKKVVIRGAGARRAASQTTTTIEFDEESRSAPVRWSTEGIGQQGLREQRELRMLAPEAREQRIAGMCGAGSSMQVARAEMPELLDPLAPLHLECEGEILAMFPPADAARFAVSVTGPWLHAVPVMSAATRVHPLVFPYPRTDLATVKIAAPPHMRPGPAPDPIRVESPFGNYFLSVAVEDGRFVVQRSFTLLRHIVEPERYAEFKSFLEEVRSADATRLEFERAPDVSM